MAGDFVMGLVTCVATVINTIFVILSYLNKVKIKSKK